MKKSKVRWSIVLVISILLLGGYFVWSYSFARYGTPGQYYGSNYYGRGMMGRWPNQYGPQTNNNQKLSIDQIKDSANNYIKGFNNNLEISDIFVYKDSDYYVSVEEKDTSKGAMELLVNPYTGYVYPEYGPNMMWNQKYGMMGSGRGSMMGRWSSNPGEYYQNGNNTGKINRDEAVKTANDYVKSNINSEYTVSNEGHEFYGYYTFHITKGNNTVGMVSVNYFTGDTWYHNWHGELEQVISNN